jgi:hypothetical protein
MGARLDDEMIATIKSAAAKLTGPKRRQFMAEVTLRYCDGSPRKAERTFGWGRQAITTGLGEARTGIRCLDDFRARGRKKAEQICPRLAEEVERIAEPHTQADPKFQTPLAYTRLTARAVREELLGLEELNGSVPCRQTVGDILNRLGLRLRRVLKAEPEKKSPRRTPSSPTSRPGGRPPERTSRA